MIAAEAIDAMTNLANSLLLMRSPCIPLAWPETRFGGWPTRLGALLGCMSDGILCLPVLLLDLPLQFLGCALRFFALGMGQLAFGLLDRPFDLLDLSLDSVLIHCLFFSLTCLLWGTGSSTFPRRQCSTSAFWGWAATPRAKPPHG